MAAGSVEQSPLLALLDELPRSLCGVWGGRGSAVDRATQARLANYLQHEVQVRHRSADRRRLRLCRTVRWRTCARHSLKARLAPAGHQRALWRATRRRKHLQEQVRSRTGRKRRGTPAQVSSARAPRLSNRLRQAAAPSGLCIRSLPGPRSCGGTRLSWTWPLRCTAPSLPRAPPRPTACCYRCDRRPPGGCHVSLACAGRLACAPCMRRKPRTAQQRLHGGVLIAARLLSEPCC